MQEFDNLKMEYAFMKVEFFIYQKKSKKKLSWTMGVQQWASWWDYLGSVWILSKGWRVVPVALGGLLKGNVAFGDATFRFWQSVKPTLNLHLNLICIGMRSRMKASKWRWVRWSHRNHNLSNLKLLLVLELFMVL
jgi:hypothetical protein